MALSWLLTVDRMSESSARSMGTPDPIKSANWPYIMPMSRLETRRRLDWDASAEAMLTGKSWRSPRIRTAAASPSASNWPETCRPSALRAV